MVQMALLPESQKGRHILFKATHLPLAHSVLMEVWLRACVHACVLKYLKEG